MLSSGEGGARCFEVPNLFVRDPLVFALLFLFILDVAACPLLFFLFVSHLFFNSLLRRVFFCRPLCCPFFPRSDVFSRDLRSFCAVPSQIFLRKFEWQVPAQKMHVHPVLRCSGAVGHTTGTITIFVFSVLGGAHGEENGGNVGSSSALRCCGADK